GESVEGGAESPAEWPLPGRVFRPEPLVVVQTEKGFMATLKEAATLLGWKWYSTFDSRRSAAGWPDVALVRPPRLILAELKLDGKKATAAEEKWLDLLGRCRGVEVFVWTPSMWDDIVKALT